MSHRNDIWDLLVEILLPLATPDPLALELVAMDVTCRLVEPDVVKRRRLVHQLTVLILLLSVDLPIVL